MNGQYDEVISIALWAIRRLPTKQLKLYALKDLRVAVGSDHKFSDFIDECISEVKGGGA